MAQHVWVRAPREEWKEMPQEDHKGWFDVGFDCHNCGCYGHAMHHPEKEAAPPEGPEEVINLSTKELVDVDGDCVEQMVDTVHHS